MQTGTQKLASTKCQAPAVSPFRSFLYFFDLGFKKADVSEALRPRAHENVCSCYFRLCLLHAVLLLIDKFRQITADVKPAFGLQCRPWMMDTTIVGLLPG